MTTELVGAAGETATAMIRSGSHLVAAGLAYAAEVARQVGCEVAWTVEEGNVVAPLGSLGTVSGDLAGILRAERPMLNLLQRACGIATATRRFMEAVQRTGCRILHTRKTAPGLRVFDVHAVLAGGGQLHRLGLDRVVMIKDNHWSAVGRRAGGLQAVVADARSRGVEAVHVEVESKDQVKLACQAGADRLLVDNQTPEGFGRLADLARQLAPGIQLEATGGITLESARAYAEAGAGFLSVGALTHSVRAVELTLEL